MICFRDRTYTTNPDCRCDRRLTDEVKKAAEKWWGGPGAPIAIREGCMCKPIEEPKG
jgi:hypothetical protein